MVRINKVYTRTGDKGETALVGGHKVPKDSLRIDCYGTVDELNAVVGLVRTSLDESPAGVKLLPIVARVQNELFNLGAQLATPDADRYEGQPIIEQRHIDALEAEIDELNEGLPALESFILPGGGWSSSYFHLARTVCRRAERIAVRLAREQAIDPLAVGYLNRLSDALFVLGRWTAQHEGVAEPLWEPDKT